MNLAMEHALLCESAWAITQSTGDPKPTHDALWKAREETYAVEASLEEAILCFRDGTMLYINTDGPTFSITD